MYIHDIAFNPQSRNDAAIYVCSLHLQAALNRWRVPKVCSPFSQHKVRILHREGTISRCKWSTAKMGKGTIGLTTWNTLFPARSGINIIEDTSDEYMSVRVCNNASSRLCLPMKIAKTWKWVYWLCMYNVPPRIEENVLAEKAVVRQAHHMVEREDNTQILRTHTHTHTHTCKEGSFFRWKGYHKKYTQACTIGTHIRIYTPVVY